MKFGSSDGAGDIHKGGRPRGSRNRLFAQVFEDVLQHWNQAVPGRNISQGMAALEVMRKERPSEYVKTVVGARRCVVGQVKNRQAIFSAPPRDRRERGRVSPAIGACILGCYWPMMNHPTPN